MFSVEYDLAPKLATSVPSHCANFNPGPGLGNGSPMAWKIPTAAPLPAVFPSNRSATYPTVKCFTFCSSSKIILNVSGHPWRDAPLGGKYAPPPNPNPGSPVNVPVFRTINHTRLGFCGSIE